jgi:acyl-coenzyme A synthetase/AMP-(fatty) acid ligase
VCAPINALFTAQELAEMLSKVDAKVIFTVASLLPVAKEAARTSGIEAQRIYICDMPGVENPTCVHAISNLLKAGSSLPALEQLKWLPGEAARRIAFLSHSSGTTGLPVGLRSIHSSLLLNRKRRKSLKSRTAISSRM